MQLISLVLGFVSSGALSFVVSNFSPVFIIFLLPTVHHAAVNVSALVLVDTTDRCGCLPFATTLTLTLAATCSSSSTPGHPDADVLVVRVGGAQVLQAGPISKKRQRFSNSMQCRPLLVFFFFSRRSCVKTGNLCCSFKVKGSME